MMSKSLLKNEIYKNRFAYALILPASIILLSIIGFPVFLNMWISLTDMDLMTGFSNSKFVGIDNYVASLKNTELYQIFFKSIWWTLSVLGFSIIIGLCLALLLQELTKLSKFFQTIWMVPWVMPGVTAAIIWVILLHPDFGPLNFSLISLHLISRPIPWLSSARFAMWGVIIAGTWKAFPFHMIMCYTALQSLPEELHDAAVVDGVNRWQYFWYIQFPWIKPVLAITSLLGFIWTFNWFALVYNMTRGGPGGKTMIVPIYIYKKALQFFDFSGASAFSMLTLLFLAVFILLYVFYATRRS